MSLRILIAVESCCRDRDAGLHKAIRDTWFKNIAVTDKRFFLGGPSSHNLLNDNAVDETTLGVQDSYEELSQKTQAICQWALEHDFDYLFKCDVDTLVNPWQFVFSCFQNHDYMGGENADVNVPGFDPERIEFCSGGAGYWLSKKALTIVSKAGSISTSAEDVWVANALLEAGIRPVFHQGYRWRPGAVVDKGMVTLHLSSALQRKYVPEMMYEYYEKVRSL
jgi:hypothetical protein